MVYQVPLVEVVRVIPHQVHKVQVVPLLLDTQVEMVMVLRDITQVVEEVDLQQ